nr:NAD-dependent epimerase/dehydratase family protein [Candidatus Njordarchaeota archaeon]
MNVVVIGGAGFIGTHVVRALARNSIRVICVDKAECNEGSKDVTVVKADVGNIDALQEILLNYNPSAVIHLVGLPAVDDCEKNPQLSFQLNALSTQNIVEAMRKADIKKLVFASTASIYGYLTKEKVSETELPRPNTTYGFHKLISEQIIRAYQERYGVNAVIFRLFNVYGGDPRIGKEVISIFIRNLLEKKPLAITGPHKFRDFIYIDDVANAFSKACYNNVPSQIINIGTGTKVTLRQLAEIFKGAVPQTQVIENQGPDDQTGICADISLARKLLDFNPLSPYEGIERHIRKYVGGKT